MKNRTTSSLVSFAAVAVALAAASMATPARADDITQDNSQFTSSKTRAEVSADLKTPYAGGSPWSSQYKQTARPDSGRTAQDAQREYLSARDEVSAFGAEDSGSSYFIKAPGRSPTATMGAPGR